MFQWFEGFKVGPVNSLIPWGERNIQSKCGGVNLAVQHHISESVFDQCIYTMLCSKWNGLQMSVIVINVKIIDSFLTVLTIYQVLKAHCYVLFLLAIKMEILQWSTWMMYFMICPPGGALIVGQLKSNDDSFPSKQVIKQIIIFCITWYYIRWLYLFLPSEMQVSCFCSSRGGACSQP